MKAKKIFFSTGCKVEGSNDACISLFFAKIGQPFCMYVQSQKSYVVPGSLPRRGGRSDAPGVGLARHQTTKHLACLFRIYLHRIQFSSESQNTEGLHENQRIINQRLRIVIYSNIKILNIIRNQIICSRKSGFRWSPIKCMNA